MNDYVPNELIPYKRNKKLFLFKNIKNPNRYYRIETFRNNLHGLYLLTKQEYDAIDDYTEILMKIPVRHVTQKYLVYYA